MQPEAIVAIVGLVFSICNAIILVWWGLRKNQFQVEKKQEVSNTEEQGQINLLVKQLEWEKESRCKEFKENQDRTDKRFETMNNRVGELIKNEQNHLHTVETKLDALSTTVTTMTINISTELAKLETVINERIPKK
jgi:Na+/glutamate symporter